MRRAAKVDLNQDSIRNALEAAGCTVQSMAMIGQGCPDLLISRAGKWHVLECKQGRGKLNDAQWRWQRSHNAPVHTVRTIDEALQAVGAIKEPA